LIILDTDIISLLDRRSGEEFERLARRLADVPDDERVRATIISFEEQMRLPRSNRCGSEASGPSCWVRLTAA